MIAQGASIGMVIARFPESTSETRAALPIIGTRSRRLSPAWSITELDGGYGIRVPERLSLRGGAVVQPTSVREHIELVALRGAFPGIEDLLDTGERAIQIRVGADWPEGLHSYTSSASMRSYSACVPTNFTYRSRFG